MSDDSQWRRDLEQDLKDPAFRRHYVRTLKKLLRQQARRQRGEQRQAR